MESIVIGIAGGTGSGKSTFTNRLKEAFGDRVSVIYYDNYYKSHDDIPLEERKLINYDHPDSFETDLLVDGSLTPQIPKRLIKPYFFSQI